MGVGWVVVVVCVRRQSAGDCVVDGRGLVDGCEVGGGGVCVWRRTALWMGVGWAMVVVCVAAVNGGPRCYWAWAGGCDSAS